MHSRESKAKPFWPEDKAPAGIARKVVSNLLRRGDYMMYDTGSVRALHYAEACAAFGALRLAHLLGDTRLLEALSARYAPERLPENTANHVDANVCGIIPLALHRLSHDPSHLAAGLGLADGQWAAPLADGLSAQTRFWIDDVWMIGILQTEAYRATGNIEYLRRAALEVDAYVRKLQQPSGLFFHGDAAPHYWGRGNGWVAAGLSEILSELPDTDPHFASLLCGYRKMMDALVAYQAEDGMWRQLIDHGEAWKETSCTAMFGYAAALGVERGHLPRKVFGPVFRKAWLALCPYVDAEGRLTEVCAGTGQKDDVDFYLNRPRVTGDLHGQAPLLWFAHALIMDGSGARG
jgi:unsaturated rhamnogalacturonyl hydrolase